MAKTDDPQHLLDRTPLYLVAIHWRTPRPALIWIFKESSRPTNLRTSAITIAPP
jgi:hypothetical protein